MSVLDMTCVLLLARICVKVSRSVLTMLPSDFNYVGIPHAQWHSSWHAYLYFCFILQSRLTFLWLHKQLQNLMHVIYSFISLPQFELAWWCR